MKFLRPFFLFTFTILLFAGCFDEPSFGDPPRLTGIDIYFKELTKTSDSLVIRVDFEDGDGDLGISGGEEGFGEFFLIPNPRTGEPWIYDPDDPELPPYSCESFRDIDLTPNDTIDDKDTVYVQYNEAYYNYSITLYTKEDGQYQEFDPLCAPPLGGRFPALRDDFTVDRPLKGTIQWGTVGAYSSRFRNDTLKIDVTIRDRAGHVSNIITKENFTLQDIRRPVGGG